MTEFATYLKGVQAKLGMRSDRVLSLKLGISTNAMYNITKGNGVPSDDLCLKIAELAGDPPEKVLLLAHTCRASEKSRPYWNKLLQVFASMSVLILLISPVLVQFSVPDGILCKIVMFGRYPLGL